MRTASNQPPKTTDALTARNRIPFKLAMLAFKLMDERGQKAISEVIRQGSRAVNRTLYDSRTVDPSRLGLRTHTPPTQEH